MAKRKYWIQKATKKSKGKLRRWAEAHHFILKNGNIDLNRAYKYAKAHHLTKRIREINMAKTLRRLRKK